MNPQERKDALHNALGEGLWGLGIGLVAPLTVMPLLLRALGGGPVEIGFVYGMATAGFLITQPIGTLLGERGAGKRTGILVYHMATSLPLFAAMSAVVWLLAPGGQTRRLARWLLIALFSVRILSVGPIVPLWQDWILSRFSIRSRGRAVGMATAASCLGVSLAALVAAGVRRKVAFPENYALLLALCTVVCGVSLCSFFFVSAGERRPGERRPSPPELFARFGQSLREPNFRSYLVCRLLLTMGSGATAFVAVHFRSPQGGGLAESTIIALGAALTLTQAASSLGLGLIGDRAGHRVGILVGAAAQMAAFAVAFAWPGVPGCVLAFVLLGLAYGAGTVSHQNMIYETCPHDNRVAHITLSNVILGPFVAAVPLATGYLVSHVGTAKGFAASMVPTGLGILWIIFAVRDPRHVELGRGGGRVPA